LFFLTCFGNSYFIITENTNYTKQDTLRYTIYSPLSSCIDYPATAYINLRNEKQQLVYSQIVRLSGEKTSLFLPLTALDSGYYFISVSGSINDKAGQVKGNTVCIAVDLSFESWDKLNKPVLHLYPEGGKAMVGFKNRFVVFQQSLSGNPLSEKLYFRNREKKLIAIGKPNALGWCAVDLPSVPGDTIYIYDAKGSAIKTLDIDTDYIFNERVFSLHTYTEGSDLIVEMMKGRLATQRKVFLEVYYKEKLLSDAIAHFRDDTVIVATTIPAAAFTNRLLRLVLKDENATILAERLYIINQQTGGANKQEISSELFCNEQAAFPGQFFVIADGMGINDMLITGMRPQTGVAKPMPEKGFTLRFSNPSLKNKEVDYSIYGGQNELLQIGSATVDSSGVVEITGSDFQGNGFVKFYENKREITGFQQVTAAISYFERENMLSVLKEVRNNNGVSNTTVDGKNDSLPVVSMKNVIVYADKKSRLDEVEDKYIRNGMFKNRNGSQMIVEDDPTAINYSVLDYLMKNIPGLMIRNRVLQYRQGYLEFFIDEILVTDLTMVSMNDIGLIKFYTNPLSSGLSAQRGGALTRGNSFAAGIQGSVAIYTKKGNLSGSGQTGNRGVMVTGYSN
jgi:hypothetical protein